MTGKRKTLLFRRVHGRIPPGYLAEAGRLISRGGVVVFPTETVYGMGAAALNSAAVMRVFRIKGRPSDNPVIVHVADSGQIGELVTRIPDKAKSLMREFWPGPLTLVMRKRNVVPDAVTAGLATVSIRVPDNSIALALVRISGTPIAAPSANFSGRPSITTFREAVEELDGRVDAIIDGGRTSIGVESTVMDMTHSIPILLRPGGIPVEDIRAVIGRVDIHPSVVGLVDRPGPAPSPGMKYRHYSPSHSKVLLFERQERVGASMSRAAERLRRKGYKVALLVTDENRIRKGVIVRMGGRDEPERIARTLFSHLRSLDRKGIDYILVEGIDEKGIGMAVMNRLRRAAAG